MSGATRRSGAGVWARAAALAAAALVADCKKVIGDSCSVSSDCSLSGDRQCDLTQRDGYCTVQSCDPNTCPDNGVCVSFDAHSPRLRRRYCMAGCDDNGDCRTGYRCRFQDARECLMSATDVLAPGQSCNVIADRSPANAAGWCVQDTECSAGTCGTTGVCVTFEANDPRRRRSTCMTRCAADADCRSPGYVCRRPDNNATRVVDAPLPGISLGWCAPATP